MQTHLKHTLYFFILFCSVDSATAQQEVMMSRPKVTLYAEIHRKNECREQTKTIIAQGNDQNHYIGLENLYDKKWTAWHLKNLRNFDLDLKPNHLIYPLDNELLYAFSSALSNIQSLETTIRRGQFEIDKRDRGEKYDPQRIQFLGQRLALNFQSLKKNYQHNPLYKVAFSRYLGIDRLSSTPNFNLSQVIQTKFPNIIDFIDALDEGFVWDQIRKPGQNNLVSFFIQSMHDNLPQVFQKDSVIFDQTERDKALSMAKQYQDQKETDDYFARSQPEYWMYIIFWRDQSFIVPIAQMIQDWQHDPLHDDKEIKIIVGADHAQDLKERILKQFAISAEINEDCL